MTTEHITTEQAVKRLREALKADEGYRYGWQSNIAMAFYDVVKNYYEENGKFPTEKLAELANQAANIFLDRLTAEYEPPKKAVNQEIKPYPLSRLPGSVPINPSEVLALIPVENQVAVNNLADSESVAAAIIEKLEE